MKEYGHLGKSPLPCPHGLWMNPSVKLFKLQEIFWNSKNTSHSTVDIADILDFWREIYIYCAELNLKILCKAGGQKLFQSLASPSLGFHQALHCKQSFQLEFFELSCFSGFRTFVATPFWSFGFIQTSFRVLML